MKAPMEDVSTVVARPVVVSIVENLEPCDALTIAVGSLEILPRQPDDDETSIIISVGGDWTFHLTPGLEVVHDGAVFLLPNTDGRNYAVALPPNVQEIESNAWSEALGAAGCLVLNGSIPEGLEGVMFLGLEFDKCGADEFEFEQVKVSKGKSLCRTVTLDDNGWFYWVGGGGRCERTRPRWNETNCVTCFRAQDTRRITWECYQAPNKGDAPYASKKLLEASMAEAAEKSAALWARRKRRVKKIASSGINAVSRAVQGHAAGKSDAMSSAESLPADVLHEDVSDDDSSDPEVVAMKAAEQAAEVGQEAFIQAAKTLVAIAINGYPRAIVSTLSRRNALLQKHSGNARSAAAELMMRNGSFQDEVKHYLLALVPGIGIPAVLVYPLWIRLRRVCLTASLFGHDLQDEAVRAKIMYAVAGIEAGFRGHMADRTLNTAVQTIWRAVAGPITKCLPVGALVSFFAGVEGRMNEEVVKAFEDGPGVSEVEFMLALDQPPTMNDFLLLLRDGGVQTAEQAVVAGAKLAGVNHAQEIGAKAAAIQAAEKMAKQAGAVVMLKAKEAKARWGSA